MPDYPARKRVADAVREDPRLELVDFTRDGYRTMIVDADTETAVAGIEATAEKAGFDVRTGPAGQELILEAPEEEASKRAVVGGNRLMSSPPGRTHSTAGESKKPASRQATPRDGPVDADE